jgi:hypothetical protein
MIRLRLLEASLAAAVVAFTASYAGAQEFSARLNGFNETPAVLTDATASFRIDLDDNAKTATYTLTYSGLSAPVTQAHIHFSKVHVAGGIFVWLCGTTTNPGPAGTPTCPGPTSGSVTRTITGSAIVSPGTTGTPPTNQGITAGDFDALEDALTSNSANANVHTTNFPAGEIRGQIRKVEREDRED